MKKINFEKLEFFTDIAKTNKVEKNVKNEIANYIYTNGSGIEMHALALKIYNSDGETEYNEKECELIKAVSRSLAPFFIDAIDNILEDESN
jgi:hypothetical protein